MKIDFSATKDFSAKLPKNKNNSSAYLRDLNLNNALYNKWKQHLFGIEIQIQDFIAYTIKLVLYFNDKLFLLSISLLSFHTYYWNRKDILTENFIDIKFNNSTILKSNNKFYRCVCGYDLRISFTLTLWNFILNIMYINHGKLKTKYDNPGVVS